MTKLEYFEFLDSRDLTDSLTLTVSICFENNRNQSILISVNSQDF